jgi:hypothetical protein
VWNLGTGEQIHEEHFGTFVRALTLSPDGNTLLVAISNDLHGRPGIPQAGRVVVYDFPAMKLRAEFQPGKGIEKDGVKYSPDGKLIAVLKKETTGNWDPEEIAIFDAGTLEKVTCVASLQMSAFDFTPDSRFIVGGNFTEVNVQHGYVDGPAIDVYDVNNGKLSHRFRGRYLPTRLQRVGNKTLIFGTRVYVYENGDLTDAEGPGPGARDSFDGRKRLYLNWQDLGDGSGRRRGTEVSLMSLDTQSMVRYFADNTPRRAGPTCSAFSPDGKYFAVGRDAARAHFGPNDPPPPFLGDILLFTIPD